MTLSPDQRRELGAFVRARREALPPAAAGQATGPQARRRTPGLRREEVAQLCAISTTWYTWLEQGRDISLSPPALARKRDPAPPSAATGERVVPPELAATLAATNAPAYLLDRLWSASAWNKPAARLFSGWLGGGEHNLLRYVFFASTARRFICDWENRARRLLAEFRADTADRADDTAIKTLVGELMDGSPAFARFWNVHAVLAREGGGRSFQHPRDGLLHYEQVTLIPAAHPDCKLVMLLPQKIKRRRP